MPTQYFHQPNIDPVLIHLWGPFQIRWYSLLYVGGFLVGRFILQMLAKEKRFKFEAKDMEQLVLWILIGAVIGARIIYCFVYDPKSLLANPLYLFQVYRGGLSFHGGLLGTVVAAIVFARKKNIPFWNLVDAMALATPTGLAMGRLGNFINGELYGRVTDVPWGVIFKEGGLRPRHPSQLYELFLEGFVLFGLCWLVKKKNLKDGAVAMMFLFGYTIIRFVVEFYREPDAHLGYLGLGFSMGQWLSIVMFLCGLPLTYYLMKRPAATPEKGRGSKRR